MSQGRLVAYARRISCISYWVMLKDRQSSTLDAALLKSSSFSMRILASSSSVIITSYCFDSIQNCTCWRSSSCKYYSRAKKYLSSGYEGILFLSCNPTMFAIDLEFMSRYYRYLAPVIHPDKVSPWSNLKLSTLVLLSSLYTSYVKSLPLSRQIGIAFNHFIT